MAFDALTLSILTKELVDTIVGGKITKIFQPERDQLIINIYAHKTNRKLLLSANANVTRIHLTDFELSNPSTAPAFCMLLRKHITNATIIDIKQMPFERVIELTLEAKSELGYNSTLRLIFELTGKTANIILVDGNYIILDSIKHLPTDIDSKRLVIVGGKYHFFEPQDKLLITEKDKIKRAIVDCNIDIRTLLQDNLLGVSNATVSEMLANIDTSVHSSSNALAVVTNIDNHIALMGSKPNVVFVSGAPIEVCPHDYCTVKGEKRYFDTLNQAHDYYYYYLDKHNRFRNKAKSTNTIVKNAIQRTEKKIAIQQQGILDAQTNTINKIYGDLILSNLHNVKSGATSVEVIDYYQPEPYPTIFIALDDNLSPQQNAQKYYRSYQKQKSALIHNTELLQQNLLLLDYLLSIRQGLANCSEYSDLEEIIDELIVAKIINSKQNQSTKNKASIKPIQPYKYIIDGFVVYVGKNNYQNNYVTFSLADKHDMWLHTQNIHSSHTIIQSGGKTIPDNVIIIAAQITAYYSQSRLSSRIAVDYTHKSNVKKPSKAALGFVTYNVYNSVIVDPCQHQQFMSK